MRRIVVVLTLEVVDGIDAQLVREHFAAPMPLDGNVRVIDVEVTELVR